MIEKELFAALKLVSPSVYLMMMPEDAVFPTITYQVIAENANQAVNSGVVTSTSFRFQVDIYSGSYAEVKALKDAVIKAVIGLGGGSISAQDIYEDSLELHRQLIDFKIKRT